MSEGNRLQEIDLYYIMQFKERWNKACGVIRQVIKKEKKQRMEREPVFINRTSSHSLNYLWRTMENE